MKVHEEALPDQLYARVMAYGSTGAGKSTLGATMPGPRAIIALDANSALPLRVSFDQVPRIYLPKTEKSRKPALYLEAESYMDCLQAADFLIQNAVARGIKSVIIDSASTVWEAVCQDVLEERQASFAEKSKSIDNLDQQGWGIAGQRYKTFMHKVHSLDCHVLWLCHAKPPVVKDKVVRGATVSVIEDPATFDISGSTKRSLPAHLGAVLYVDRHDLSAEKPIIRLGTRSTERYYAKDNTNTLDPVEDPDMMIVLARMGYLPEAEAEAILAAIPKKTVEQAKNQRLGALD